jgi:hypothetical protein
MSRPLCECRRGFHLAFFQSANRHPPKSAFFGLCLGLPFALLQPVTRCSGGIFLHCKGRATFEFHSQNIYLTQRGGGRGAPRWGPEAKADRAQGLGHRSR